MAGLALRSIFLGLVVPAVAVMAGAGRAARADETVLPLHVEAPKLAAKDRDTLSAALRAKLALYPGVKLATPPDGDLTDLMLELECVDIDATCLGRIGAKLGADRVVYVEADAKVVHVRVVAVDAAGKSGKMLRDKDAKVGEDAAAALGAEIEAVWGKPPVAVKVTPVTIGKLTIHATPGDAAIFVGEEAVGAGDVTIEREAGEYTVHIVAKGFEDQIFKVVVPAGGEITKEIVLKVVAVTPPDKDPKKVKPSGGMSWVWWTVIGVVVVGGAVAIGVLASQSDGASSPRGPALIGLDPGGAWRDPATLGGRP